MLNTFIMRLPDIIIDTSMFFLYHICTVRNKFLGRYEICQDHVMSAENIQCTVTE